MGHQEQTTETSEFIRSLREKALERHRGSSATDSSLEDARQRLAEQRRLISRHRSGTTTPTAPPSELGADDAVVDEREARIQAVRDKRSIIRQLSEEPVAEAAVIEHHSLTQVADEPPFEPEAAIESSGLEIEASSIEAAAEIDFPTEAEACDPMDVAESTDTPRAQGCLSEQPDFHSIVPLPLKARPRLSTAVTTVEPPAVVLPMLEEELETPLVGFAEETAAPVEIGGSNGARPKPKFASLDAFDMDEDADEEFEETVFAPRIKVTMTRSTKRNFWPFGGG
jgi:hypothetical protein